MKTRILAAITVASIMFGHVLLAVYVFYLRLEGEYLAEEVYSILERIGPISFISISVIAAAISKPAQESEKSANLGLSCIAIAFAILLEAIPIVLVGLGKEKLDSMDEILRYISFVQTVIGGYVGAILAAALGSGATEKKSLHL